MKTLFAAMFLGLFLLVVFVQWRIDHPAVARASVGSQIYIHGTPVCVFEVEGSIAARVGRCDGLAGPAEEPEARIPFHGFPGGGGMRLPPGHPPIDGDVLPKAPDRTLI